MSKNIETCKSEEVLSSVLDQQPQDYPSVQQAVHDLGVTALPAASAADPDIEELPSNVEVFVRRVLKAVVYDRVLPVVQQMWQAVLNRISSPNYLPDSLRPYAQDPSLRTLGTLPTALSALSVRKISDLGDCPDGISLARLLCHVNTVTELKDDHEPWGAYQYAFPFDAFTSLKKVTLNCESLYNVNFINGTTIEEVYLPYLKSASNRYMYAFIINNSHIKKLNFPSLKTTSEENGYPLIRGCSELEEVELPASTYIDNYVNHCLLGNCPKIKRIGCDTTGHNSYSGSDAFFGSPSYMSSTTADLIDIEFGMGGTLLAYNTNLCMWNPTNVLADADKTATFLENFLHHIAERLAVGPTTNRLTLTLSADVYSACGFGATIDDTTDIRYLIKKAIQDRNWKVTDGTNNFNQ